MRFSNCKTALRLFTSVNVNKYSYQNFPFKVQPQYDGPYFNKNRHVPNLFVFFAAKELGKQLEAWLSAADLTHGPARAIIAP